MRQDERPELELLRIQNEELAGRLREHENLAALRVALRACENIESIAACGADFVRSSLDAHASAVLIDDSGEWVGGGPDAQAVRIRWSDALVDRLARGAFVVDPHEDVELGTALRDLSPGAFADRAGDVVVAPVTNAEGEPIALIVAMGISPGPALERLSAELAFSMIGAARDRAHAEELAMLAVQERELVGLLREVEQRDAVMRADLEQAREFQHLMLGALPSKPGVRVEAMYEPLGVVGGDLYAVSEHGERIRVFIADATGHGVRASLTTMFIKNGYDAVKLTAPDPATLLELLNDNIARTYRTAEMLFTAVCLDLDVTTGELSVACAGNPPSCIVRKDGLTMLEGGGALMGLRPRMRFPLSTERLEPGDGIYVFTDGVADTHSEAGELFGEERLFEMIRTTHEANGSTIDVVRAAIKAFSGSRGLTDDATLLGLVLEAGGS